MRRSGTCQLVIAPIGLFALLVLMSSLSWADPVTAFPLRNINGNPFVSAEHEKPIIISFFFPSCPPCKEEIPLLYQWVAQELPDAALLFVDRLPDDSIDTIRQYVQRVRVHPKFFYSDASGEATKQFFATRPFVCPTIVGIKEGAVVFHTNRLTSITLQQLHAALE